MYVCQMGDKLGKLNILHIIDKLSMDGVNPSSCTVLLGDWAANLDPGRYAITVCTLRRPDPAGTYLEERGINVHYLGYGKISPGNIRGISKLIDSEQADIVHLHGYSAANFGRLAARIQGIPNIVHEHAVLRIQPHQYIADKLLSGLTDAAIAVSENVRDFMVRGRSISPQKIHIIGNGIELHKYRRRDGAFREKQRMDLGIRPETRIVGIVTRLREEKGNIYLIEALPAILGKGIDMVLLVAGDGPLRVRLEQRVRELGLEQVVRFLGFRSDVPELLSLFDIQVIPSLTEGFPLCLAEAMAAENAIVATAVGGMKDIGREGETVLFVPPADSEALASRIGSLLLDSKLASQLARNAGNSSELFDIRHCASRLAQTYDELACKQRVVTIQ